MRSHYFGSPTAFICCADGDQLESQIKSTVNHKWRAHGLVLSLSRRKYRFRPKSEWPNNKLPFNDVKNTRRCHGDHIGGRERATPSCLPPLMVCGGGGGVRSTVSVRRACHGASKEISIAIEEGRREGALTALLSSRSKSRVLLSSRCN